MVDQRFQGFNRLFVLLLENNTERTVRMRYFLQKVEVNDYNVIIESQTFWSTCKK